MKTISALKLGSVRFTSVSTLLWQWYTGPLCPSRQKPKDVIKCCMFTLSQQDTDQRRTRKAKLINTVSLWTHTADNQSTLLLWIKESVLIRGVKKHATTCGDSVHHKGSYSQVDSTLITSMAADTLHSVTQGHMLAQTFWSQASMTSGSFCPTSHQSEQTKDYAVFINVCMQFDRTWFAHCICIGRY